MILGLLHSKLLMIMSAYDYDLFVIGGGSGGVRAARWSASLGAKTALCEWDKLGGTCVLRGCIPKKLMVYASQFPKHIQHAKSFGWKLSSADLNWRMFNQNRHKEIKRLENIYTRMLKKSSVHVIKGKAVLKNARTVQVQKKQWTARRILIAVGGKPKPLNIPGAEHALNSNDMFNLPQKPKSLLVIGAGYIALEFASIFNELGVKVKVLLRRGLILRSFDRDVRCHLQEQMALRGVQFSPQTVPVKIFKKGALLCVKDQAGKTHLAEKVLIAAGRTPQTEDINLRAVGVQLNSKGAVQVNSKWETSLPGVFAIGDCADTPYDLTPTATAEGMALSERLFSKKTSRFQLKNNKAFYKNIPTAVFTQPPAAVIGLTEEQAQKEGIKIQIYESRFRPLNITLTKDPEKTYIKLIADSKTQVVLGCHIVGCHAAEILQGFAVAVKAGLTKKHWDQTIGLHPTSAEECVTLRSPRTMKPTQLKQRKQS